MNTDHDLDPGTPDVIALQAEYERKSRDAAQRPGARLDVAYGAHERQRLDVFSAGPHAPVLVFFHGGYWRAGSKDARRFPAPAWNARGVSWVTVNYRLAPQARLSAIVSDARDAVAWIDDNAGTLDLNVNALHLTGNSAGAHLAAMAATACWSDRQDRPTGIRSLSVISGLFDLSPLIGETSNEWLHLTEQTAHAASPIHHLPPSDLPILVGLGGKETSAFKRQSQLFAKLCQSAGNPVRMFESPEADHFKIIGEYGVPDSPLFAHLERAISDQN
ncbi:MAG: alpha/beta hydrolase [Alphaproteobacteria bacterium]|nr:alpha/beta hydrolase [Alphaproteobacteria bacterium]